MPPSDENSNRVLIINSEIDASIATIHQGKKILVNFITIYVTGIFGLFYYGAYVQGKITSSLIQSSQENNELLVLGLIGVLLVLIIFLFGWALLDLVTRTIFATIKQYKHISYMRNLSAEFFPPGIFQSHCLNPIGNPQDVNLPIRISTSLPFLFSLVNFMLLFTAIYFLKIFLTTNQAISLFLIPIGFFALFYTNILSKHFSELKIVQTISPLNNEKLVRQKYEEIKKNRKKQQKYKISYIILIVLSLGYFGSFYFNTKQWINKEIISQDLITIQGITAFVIAFLSLLLSILKVETTITFKINPTLDI